MLGAVFDLLVSLATTVLTVGFIASLFLDMGAGHAGAPEDDSSDEADLPPAGVWDSRKAWGRWEGPLERDRYYAARGVDRCEF
ncbi:MAG: hypothetical protein AB7O64_15700 [Methylibium sp.]